jgi:hypothetical protein
MSENCLQGARGGLVLEQARGRFRKELIHTGEYTLPADLERKVIITIERLSNWIKAFQESGVKVWVPLGHSRAPEQNVGWVTELILEDESLVGILEITDPEIVEKLRQGSIADVSIGVEYEFVDCNGTSWPEIIRHVALTVDPHIREQGAFAELPPDAATEISDDELAQSHTQPQVVEADVEKLDEMRDTFKPEDRIIELEALSCRRRELDRQEVEREVEEWLAAGKITPAVRSRLVELLLSGAGQFLYLEQESLSFAAVLRTVFADMPGGHLKAEQKSRLGLVPPDAALEPNEKKLLAKLGISEELYLQYRN